MISQSECKEWIKIEWYDSFDKKWTNVEISLDDVNVIDDDYFRLCLDMSMKCIIKKIEQLNIRMAIKDGVQ